ncbi:MAG: hypothetical protein WC209_16005 [Ignavibacteriaceae bacterium]|jgi:hypothetical protein
MKKDDRKEKAAKTVLVKTRLKDCYNRLKKGEKYLALTFSKGSFRKQKSSQAKEIPGFQEVKNLIVQFAQKSPGGTSE